jgi:hypothetical protein
MFAAHLTVMGVSFVIHYFIPNNFDFKNDNPLSFMLWFGHCPRVVISIQKIVIHIWCEITPGPEVVRLWRPHV